jgi:alpha-D-xyloside xylohydrolase
MKFTNGYWLMRQEITPLFAVEYAGHQVEENKLTVYAVGKHITNRGDCLNIGMLTVTLNSPTENVIHVELTHFAGSSAAPLPMAVKNTAPEVSITETDTELVYRSGTLRAVVNKTPGSWGITYYEGETRLTATGYRNEAYMQNRDTGRNYMVEQLELGIGESVYGLGEQFTPFVKNGQSVGIWNEDGGTASEQTYKNIPFYLSSRGYGVLVESYGDLEFEIASEKVENVQFSVLGEKLGYYVIAGGSPKGTVAKYCELTGKPALPPAWSFGLWLTTSFTTNYDESTTSSFINGMKERNIPLSVFHFDCCWMRAYHWCDFIWDPETFPDPAGMLQRYHDKGLKICVWINPYIAQQSYLFKEGMEHGYLLKKTDGSVWQTDLWQPGMAIIDFTNPAATQWYQSKLTALLDMGVDCFKTDFGERIPVQGIQWFNGADPVQMHNYYTYLYNQAVFTLLEEQKGKGNAVLFARSATTGGQQFPAHWGGDCSASYLSMAETLRGGLSLACSGFGFWSHDISGFEQTATPDLYKRWCQFGLLSSHSRLHGSSSYRVPWNFDEEACDVLREMVNLKCRLMPYLYQRAVVAHETGVPMLRPMFMEFPEDRTCHALDTQYMMGESLLVAPVFQDNGEAEYYLPAGTWFNLLTGETFSGGTWRKDTFDYHALPLLVRENTILPVGSCKEKPDYDYSEGVELCLSHFGEGAVAEAVIPDLQGNPVMKASAVRRGSQITLTVEGGKDWSCRVLTSPNAQVARQGNVAVITLSE